MIKPTTLAEAARLTDDQARELLEGLRWPKGYRCPFCDGSACRKLGGKAALHGHIKCYSCRKMFSVTVGTIMHRSHIALRLWVLAFYSICAHKKGVSALQLRRDLGLGTYKTAWHLAHRIREAMRFDPLAGLFKGVIEADETYVGGKSRKGWPGRGSERKTPVMLVLEREGRVVGQFERLNF